MLVLSLQDLFKLGNYLDIFFRSFVSLVVLFVITEIMGKKQISQLNLFDYIIGISIGSIAASLSVDDSIEYLDGILAIVVYGIFATLVSLITTKSIWLRRFFTGTPLVLMDHGKIIYENLKKSKLDIHDFLQIARENGFYDITQINCSILETSGKVSFLLRSKYQPLTPNDQKLKVSENGLVCNLVIDGKIMPKHLKYIHKDQKWLMTRLENMGYKDLSNLLLVTCDNQEKLAVFTKEEMTDKIEILE